MTDIIEQALEEWVDEEEREATGTISGHEIRLVKREYQQEQRGPTAWKIAVFIRGDGPLATESIKDLDAGEAQKKFEELINIYPQLSQNQNA